MSSVVEGLTQGTSLSFVPAMEEESVVDACAAIIVAYEDDHRATRKQRSTWTNDWLLKRNELGSYATLQRELRFSEKLYHKYLCMPVPVFDLLLSRVQPYIERQDTVFRKCIPPGARLEATLLFLLSGMNYTKLQMETRNNVRKNCARCLRCDLYVLQK